MTQQRMGPVTSPVVVGALGSEARRHPHMRVSRTALRVVAVRLPTGYRKAAR